MRSAARALYYLSALAREPVPYRWFVPGLRRNLARSDSLTDDLRERLDHCNLMTMPWTGALPTRLGDLGFRDGSRYYIDLMRMARGFGPDFRLSALFGDITHVPDLPSLVKSRPIAGDRANAVLLPLNAFRHLYFPRDPVRFEDKLPTAVWRGHLNNGLRRAAVRRFFDSKDHDIAHIAPAEGLPPPRRRLSIAAQQRHRYILSLEGNDVATNLKWIMASGSIAVSPRLRYETWFMKGKLIPGVHFIEVRDDLSDLDAQIARYEADPAAARAIVRQANAWVDRFRHPRTELMLGQLVLGRYARLTGQDLPA